MVATSVLHAQTVAGREATEADVEPLTWWLYEEGMAQKAPLFVAATATLQTFARGIVQFWDGYDIVLTPALAKRPVRHGEIDPCGENPAYEFKKSGEFTPYTAGVERDRPAGDLACRCTTATTAFRWPSS